MGEGKRSFTAILYYGSPMIALFIHPVFTSNAASGGRNLLPFQDKASENSSSFCAAKSVFMLQNEATLCLHSTLAPAMGG